ncbi:hypothetical protein [Cryptosporangium phraense]|uniref:Uncharacterized protein n=1 Tax=Cryptosporangium phraense TaxID=2593070 RepID=A0A545APQ5_9ACTN|nr:hypothetical protein [Cryptosporangium phraense]TQS43283.1 hypothetical protein FL583_20830 [Cryptosporangium phraense]
MRRKPSHLSLAPPLQSRPSDALPENLVRLLFRQAGNLLEIDDPIQVELWCSDVLGAVWAATDGDPTAEETFVGAWIAAAEEDDDEGAALVALTALGAIAGSGSARRAALAAADRLGEPRPRWAAAVDEITSGECWHYGDVYGDQETILCAFRRGETEHAMLVLIDYTLGGIAKDVFFTEAVAGSLADLQYELGSTPVAFLEPIEPGVARRRLQRAFRTTDGRVEPRVKDDFAPHRALALARVRTLPPSIELDEPEPAVDPDVLIEEFLSSSEAADLPDFEMAERWARLLVDRALNASDDPARVGPGVLDELLLVDVPEHAALDAAARNAMPAVLTAWTLWAGRRQGLSEPAVAWLQTALDEILEEFPEAYRDPGAIAHRNTCPDTVDLRSDRPAQLVRWSLRSQPISPTVLRATSTASRVGRGRPK